MTKPTCPEYTWLSLATPKKHDYTSIILRTMADTEEEVRDIFPCWNPTLATKIHTESNPRDSGCGTYGLNLLASETLEVHNV